MFHEALNVAKLRLIVSISIAFACNCCAHGNEQTNVLNSVDACAKNQPVVVGLVRYTAPAPFDPIVKATIETIKKSVAGCKVEVVSMAREDLESAVIEGKVDIFLSSAGFYRRLSSYGAKDLATAMSPSYPDPNRSEGAVIVVSNRFANRRNIDSLVGLRLAVPGKKAFSGYQIPMGEIARRGHDYEKFFSSVTEVGDGGIKPMKVFDEVVEGRADVAFAKQCVLEEYLKRHPENGRFIRIVNPINGIGECARSTELYPTWTLGSSSAVSPQISRLITAGVLAMPSTESGLMWGIATDFSNVDRLFKDLKVGPYEYLRHRTIKSWVESYWPFLILVLFFFVGLIFHSIIVTHLVKIRTRELQNSLNEQKRLQEKAHAASEKLNAFQKIGVVNQISSILAHELRQPLGAVSLYIDGLKSMIIDGNWDAKKSLRTLELMSEQTERIDAIMQKVRNYRKNQSELDNVLAISQTTHQAVDIFEHSMMKKGVPIDRYIDPNLFIRGDGFEIGLLVVNLVKNAVESVEKQKNGRVAIMLRRMSNEVKLSVSDNGNVRTRQELDKIAQSTDSTKKDGLGLGLQIVYGVAERHRASILFSLNQPCGVCVTLTFPLVKENADNRASKKGRIGAVG